MVFLGDIYLLVGDWSPYIGSMPSLMLLSSSTDVYLSINSSTLRYPPPTLIVILPLSILIQTFFDPKLYIPGYNLINITWSFPLSL